MTLDDDADVIRMLSGVTDDETDASRRPSRGEDVTERAFTLPRKLRGCSWSSRKDSTLGALIILAQVSFDRDKTR